MTENVFMLGPHGMERLSKRPTLKRGTKLIYHWYAGNTSEFVLLDDATGRAANLTWLPEWDAKDFDFLKERFEEPRGEYDYSPGPYTTLDEFSKHISQQFGIGIYYTDEVLSEEIAAKAEECANYWEQCIENGKRKAQEAWDKAVAECRAEWGGILTEKPDYRKGLTDNVRAYLKHLFPGEKFSVRRGSYGKAYVSWKDGRSEKEVQRVLNIWQTGHSDPTGDYWDDTYSVFTSLYGGFSYGVDAERTLTEEAKEGIRQYVAENFPEIPQDDDAEGVDVWRDFNDGQWCRLEEWLGGKIGHYSGRINMYDVMYVAGEYKSLLEPKKEQDKADGGSTNAQGLTIVDYSEKAFVVQGDTKPLAGTLKELGGRFNARLSCGMGWVFSKKALDKVKLALGI